MAKVMISMPDELLKKLDKAARFKHKKRSELIKDLALQFLEEGALKKERGLPQSLAALNPFERLREYTFELDSGETTEGLIREIRES